MNINKKRLGFTLVELLVVIAIIAVLATVALIGYNGFIYKAYESNDNGVITELNHYLKASNPLDEEIPTPSAAAKLLEESGLNIAYLQPSRPGWHYGYNYEKKEFVIVGEDWKDPLLEAGNEYKTMIFANTDTLIGEAFAHKYSVYVQKSYQGTVINAEYGVDTGLSKVTQVNYAPAHTNRYEVNICTNSATTALKVNAPIDVVHHYGVAGSVDIIAVANASYHENGTVAFLEVAKGRVALESESKVTQIHINTKVESISDEGEVTSKSNTKFDEITISKAANVEMPKFTRDPVEIDEEKGTLVVALQDGTEKITETTELDYVWLTAVGIYEQVTVSSSASDAGNEYAASSDNIDSEKKITAQQIANNITATVNNEEYILKASFDEVNQEWNYTLESDTQENITENVTVAVVEEETIVSVNSVAQETSKENGLTEEAKTDAKEELVETAIIEEEKAKEEAQGICQHDWQVIKTLIEPDCLTAGLVREECTICHDTRVVDVKELEHDLIGIFCNRCRHPVAFVDEINDYTINDPQNRRMDIYNISEILNGNSGDNSLYLDIAYSFKSFPNMAEKDSYLDDEILYKLDTNTFKFSLKEEKDPDEGLYFTAKDIYDFFGTWYCDYYVSFDSDVDANSCGLGGVYEAWGMSATVAFLAPVDIPANYEVGLLAYMTNGGISDWSYNDITNIVGEFKCGFFNLSNDNNDVTFTVKLRMLNPDVTNSEDYNKIKPIYNSTLGINLPRYIDVAVTNYVIKAPSQQNLAIINSTND